MHVGEATLDKRVSEFTSTDQAALTANDFNIQILKDQREEAERIEALSDPLTRSAAPPEPQEEGCQHVSKLHKLLLVI